MGEMYKYYSENDIDNAIAVAKRIYVYIKGIVKYYWVGTLLNNSIIYLVKEIPTEMSVSPFRISKILLSK